MQNEVFTTPDGSVRIKFDHFDRFWRRSPNWIWAYTDDTTNNSNALFWPITVENNVVALHNLNVIVPTIIKEACLEVGELVLSRNIDNGNFRLMDARIYNQSVMVMATQQATNMTNQPTNHIGVYLHYYRATNG